MVQYIYHLASARDFGNCCISEHRRLRQVCTHKLNNCFVCQKEPSRGDGSFGYPQHTAFWVLGLEIRTQFTLTHLYLEARFYCIGVIIGPQRKKTCLQRFANSTGTEQPAHLVSRTSAFVFCLLARIIYRLAAKKI